MNVYYFNLPNGDDVKPISAIINVLAARIASGYDPYVTVFDLLEYVLGELSICAQQQDLECKISFKIMEKGSICLELMGNGMSQIQLILKIT